MLKVKALVLASLLATVGVAQAAELKVGYVDTQRIFRDAPLAQKAGKKNWKASFPSVTRNCSAWPNSCKACRRRWKRTP